VNTCAGKSIILASVSPRRRQLLQGVGVPFEVIPSQIEEDELPGETPRDHVMRLSRAKAIAVGSNKVKDRWVLGADTIVCIDGELLGKPGSENEARAMLKKLSGREHRVVTGFFIYNPEREQSVGDAVESRVHVKELNDREIEGYIRTGEPFDKAGGYAVQGIGMFMVERIVGSHTNVIGLPICEVVAVLRELEAIRFLE
jgi:septum formation protein